MALAVSVPDGPALALGCEVLGSGGGGATSSAQLVLAHHLARTGPVPLLTGVADLADDAVVACVGAYGSSTLMLESLPGPLAFHAALDALERLHHRVDAVLPLEVGGVNGVLAVLVAATRGLPLVDADPMGRAFSRLSDTILASHVALREIFFAGTGGQLARLEAASGPELEALLQSLLPAAGGWGAVAVFPSRAADLLPHAVRGSVSRALTLGRALLAAAAGEPDHLLGMPGVELVLEGWVTEVRRAPGVEVRGVASLAQHGVHAAGRWPARLDFANEYLGLLVAGEVSVSAPDVICVLDSDWLPVPADELRTSQQVRVLAVSAPEVLRDAHAASGAFGLAARGYQEVIS